MSDLKVGLRIELADGRFAIVRYIGQPHFAAGDWVGVELEDDSGKNDGSVQGERYFDCEMGRGMFVRPQAITVIEQPAPPIRAASGNGVKKATRPSSAIVGGTGKRTSAVPDLATGKRMSMNAASPTPAPGPGTRRPSSMARSPTKSPTKQLASATTSGASTPRGGMHGTRASMSSTSKSRTSMAGGKTTSMGPPAAPASRTARMSLAGAPARPSVTTTKSTPARPSFAPKPAPKAVGSRLTAATGRQRLAARGGQATGQDSGGDTESPAKEDESDSPRILSPTISRTAAMDTVAGTPSPSRGLDSPGLSRSTAAGREVEDLKTKLRLMEKKRAEDRDKLKALEKVQSERDKFEAIIQKLQAKYQPQQQEITDLRKQLKEQATKFEEMENQQAEHDMALEMATLDREMAEETAEVLKTELESLKQRTEELELEVEVLREENDELGQEMSPEEKTSAGWLQMERNNERLREALLRLRDMTQQTEAELKEQIKSLEEDVQDLGNVKEQYEITKERLAQSEAGIEDLRQQLDNALGAEDMIEELTDRNMAMAEQIDELKVAVEDLESLKELNDELEINHVETEKEMQQDLDWKDNIIAEQARRAAQQEEALEDMEYTLSRFRELVTNLQTDLEDMRASHAVTETESEQLNNRSRAMMDLNMKLQLSAAKTQVKTIDLELRRLDAQEASEHLAIVQLFLPEAFHADRDSVLALLRFKRVGFKANLLAGFVKERVNGTLPVGHEDDVFAGCDMLDKLAWVSAMCDRFVNAISHCSVEQFAKFEGALYELEPVERALNNWIDGLRRDELKEKTCAAELSRTIALMSHLAEVHITDGLASYADDIHMRTVLMQSRLENTAAALFAAKTMVQNLVPEQGEDDELAQHFAKKADAVISNTRSAKVIIGKAVRSLEELRTRALSLPHNTSDLFEQCETGTEELAAFSRRVGEDLFVLLHEEGRAEPFTYSEVTSTMHRTTTSVFSSSESDLLSTFSNKLRTLTASLNELSAMASDLEITQEFERASAPWILRARELSASKVVPIDTEEEMRRLKEENHERARMVAMRDQTLEEASVKIELLESRMRDAAKKNERITALEKELAAAKQHEQELTTAVENQNKELSTLESDREKWKKLAGEAKVEVAPGSKAGQERAVATAREMGALKNEISSLQAAVRFLREDNHSNRMYEARNQDWLAAPLLKPKSKEEQRKALVVSEGREVLNQLLNLTTSAKVYDLSTLPEDKLAWCPERRTPQYHVEREKEHYAHWNSWQQSVLKKAQALAPKDPAESKRRKKRLAKVELQLGIGFGKQLSGRRVEIVQPDDFDSFRSQVGMVNI